MLSDLVIRMRSLVRRRAVEADLDDELSFHLSHLTEKFIRAGLTPDEARRRARIELGGMEQTKEECRQCAGCVPCRAPVAGRRRMRSARSSEIPALPQQSSISLTLGIGANTAVFSLLDAVMWRNVRVNDPGSLLFVGYGNVSYTFTYQQFRTLRRSQQR